MSTTLDAVHMQVKSGAFNMQRMMLIVLACLCGACAGDEFSKDGRGPH
jgi:hypothetical protein